MEELDGAFSLSFTRASLTFKVTVAYSVLEWFIDVSDEQSKLRFTDWCDYAGYDETPHGQLAQDMTEDLHRLMATLLAGRFRLLKAATWLRPSDRCEWRVNGEWVEFDVGTALSE